MSDSTGFASPGDVRAKPVTYPKPGEPCEWDDATVWYAMVTLLRRLTAQVDELETTVSELKARVTELESR